MLTRSIRVLYNYAKNTGIQVTFSGGGKLCGQDAEWILEDPLVPFPNFTPASFYNEISWTASGQTYGISGADFAEVENSSGDILCHVSLASDGTDITLTD
jgi:hypothetical protein